MVICLGRGADLQMGSPRQRVIKWVLLLLLMFFIETCIVLYLYSFETGSLFAMVMCFRVLFSLSDYSSGAGYPALEKSEVSDLLLLWVFVFGSSQFELWYLVHTLVKANSQGKFQFHLWLQNLLFEGSCDILLCCGVNMYWCSGSPG